jgi:UDP-N-acetyl-D-mannosaminuronic acid transferase (WecB/TagA/CpsF family)
MAPDTIQTVKILQIPFAIGNVAQLTDAVLNLRGLITAPSAPCLVLAAKDPAYSRQLAASKLALADSGAMVLMWRLARPATPLRRVSGLAFLKEILKDERIRRPGALFLVDPSPEAGKRNRQWLHSIGIDMETEDQYIAPIYQPGAVEDSVLLNLLRAREPRYVLINLGGGVQERLGAWLQQEWLRESGAPNLPSIICTGAAIAFLTGEQSRIPLWADRFYLGWAIRCVGRPTIYVPRYFKSIPVLYYTLRDAIKKGRKEPDTNSASIE